MNKKLVTFTWAITVEVPEDFSELDIYHVQKARHEAYSNVQESDGKLTDVQEQ